MAGLSAILPNDPIMRKDQIKSQSVCLSIIRHLATPFLILFLVASAHAEELRGKVISIADGDTLTILDASKGKHKIRLHGIDAPAHNQAFGSKAKQALSERVGEKDVRVVWKERDRYGRIVGDRWINREMVEVGLAWHYKAYSKDKKLAEAEDLARKEKRSLWADKEPAPPWEFRKKERERVKK